MTELSTDSPAALQWQADQTAAALTTLEALPEFEPLHRQVLARSIDGKCWPVRRRGALWFQLRRDDLAAELPCLTVRSAPDAQPRVLIDPNEIAAKRGVPVDLQWAEPSPDGRIVAFAVTEAGNEVAELQLLDVATGTLLPDVVPWSVNFPVSWLPDSSGFWCAGREVVDGVFTMPIYRYVVGEAAPVTPLELPDGLLFPRPSVSQDGRFVAIETGNSEGRLDYLVTSDGEVRPLLLGVEGAFAGHICGDDLLAVTDNGAPRGRLVRIPLASAQDTSTWTELVPETSDVLRGFDVVGDRIVLALLRDATARLRVLDLGGRLLHELPLPGEGVVGAMAAGVAHLTMPMFVTGDGEISFVYSDFATAPAVYRYVVAEERLELVDPPAVVLDGLTVTLIEGISADGTRVPAHVVHRTDLDLSRSHPTLVTGYGGFSLAMLPSYLSGMAPWVEAGGIYVLSHLRGGSEYGRQWWVDGSREHKQHTFDDLFAVAERLVDLGLTTPQQLAMYGNSNGGLLAGAAVAQRPDLWAAVVPDVPLIDMQNMHRDPFLYAIGKGEYGDPLVPEEAEWLRRHSPLEHIRPADHPATLVIAGNNDPRCPAWHSRVLVDGLRRAQQGSAPILLRVHADQGHGTGGAHAAARRTAEWLAFCAHHTGLEL
jgi:prolyl oligopeptidase